MAVRRFDLGMESRRTSTAMLPPALDAHPRVQNRRQSFDVRILAFVGALLSRYPRDARPAIAPFSATTGELAIAVL